MIKKISSNGEVCYDIVEFVLDTPEDLETLNKQTCGWGSSAFVISTGEAYMKNSNGEWVKL